MAAIVRLENFPPPPLSTTDIHVFTTYVEDISDHELLQSLNQAEQARARRFVNPEHGHRFSLIRGLLRHWLGYYLDLAPASVVFQYNDFGQPWVKPQNPNRLIHFNISHSHNMAAFSFARVRVGIDIEFMKTMKNLNAMTRHICHPDELLEFESLAPKQANEAFFRLWTRKESFIKANGQGLSMGLRSIFIGSHPQHSIHHVKHKNLQLNNWTIQDLPCPNDYKLAIAFETLLY